jgi:hypothetical protein
LGKEGLHVLDELPAALEKAMPLKRRHKEDLPAAVRDLSKQLTSERGGLVGGYLQTPRTLAAYAHYFLPWNVYRQARLFAGQWLHLPHKAVILDLGSGPLTSVMALWAARPDLRDKVLSFICVDHSRKALQLGADLFRSLGGTWGLNLVEQPVERYLRTPEPAHCIILGNVLNELRFPRDTPLEQGVEALASNALAALKPGDQTRILVVEPGTRLGGKMVAFFRKACLKDGLAPQSPCTHADVCPMLSADVHSWCHFRFTPADAPQWLQELSSRTGLPKGALALSFLNMGRERRHKPGFGRVLSGAIKLPGKPGAGRYVCTAHGLALLENAPEGFGQGSVVRYALAPGGGRDTKTALPLIVADPPKHAGQSRDEPRGQRSGPGETSDKGGGQGRQAGGKSGDRRQGKDDRKGRGGAGSGRSGEKPDRSGPGQRRDDTGRAKSDGRPGRPGKGGSGRGQSGSERGKSGGEEGRGSRGSRSGSGRGRSGGGSGKGGRSGRGGDR